MNKKFIGVVSAMCFLVSTAMAQETKTFNLDVSNSIDVICLGTDNETCPVLPHYNQKFDDQIPTRKDFSIKCSNISIKQYDDPQGSCIIKRVILRF
jgi:hypothetical protein